jgi:hypothetical protein
MTNALDFDALKGILQRRINQLPDHRKPTHYPIKDATLGAFGIFYTQSPSFLDYQHHLQQSKGQNNACTLFGVEQIPCNNQVRNLLDPLLPSHFRGPTAPSVSNSLRWSFWSNWLRSCACRASISFATEAVWRHTANCATRSCPHCASRVWTGRKLNLESGIGVGHGCWDACFIWIWPRAHFAVAARCASLPLSPKRR